MKTHGITIVDGLSRVHDDDVAAIEGANVAEGYVRVNLRLVPLGPQSAGMRPISFLVESLGGIDLIVRRDNVKGIYIGQKLSIRISDEEGL